jgi:soluble lytic murein transglycosylase-like protein
VNIFTRTLITRFRIFHKFILPSMMLGGFIPSAFFSLGLPHPSLDLSKLTVSSTTLTAEVAPEPTPVALSSLVETFFGSGTAHSVTDPIVNKQINLVRTRKAFPASLAVIKKHEATIRAEARKQGVPEDVALGVALLENGGSETAVSSAGALGVFQLMPGTARALGLEVDKKVDERKNVNKNIAAGVSYLKANFERFGDWGLATWAYHAGEGNVSKALKLYAAANQGIALPGVKDAAKLRAYVEKYGITIHKLLSSSAVKVMTKKLSDDSAGYPYKVIATASLFRNS